MEVFENTGYWESVEAMKHHTMNYGQIVVHHLDTEVMRTMQDRFVRHNQAIDDGGGAVDANMPMLVSDEEDESDGEDSWTDGWLQQETVTMEQSAEAQGESDVSDDADDLSEAPSREALREELS